MRGDSSSFAMITQPEHFFQGSTFQVKMTDFLQLALDCFLPKRANFLFLKNPVGLLAALLFLRMFVACAPKLPVLCLETSPFARNRRACLARANRMLSRETAPSRARRLALSENRAPWVSAPHLPGLRPAASGPKADFAGHGELKGVQACKILDFQ